MKRTLAASLAASLFGVAFAGNSYFFGNAVKDAELDQLRGGLTLPTSAGQLNLSFGIERMVVINDELIAVTQLLIPQLTSAMGKGASNVGTSNVKVGTSNVEARNAGASNVGTSNVKVGTSNVEARNAGASNVGTSNVKVGTSNVKIAELAPVVVIQSGPGNIAMPDISQLNAAIGTVIQNTLNQQHIQTATVITVTTNSMELTRATALQAATSQALTSSMR